MRSVDRVASILNCLAHNAVATIVEIADATGLPRPTLRRITKDLSLHGLVMKAGTEGYSIGPGLVLMALKHFNIVDLKTAATSAMECLVEQTGETVALTIMVGDQRVFIHEVQSNQTVRRVLEMNVPLPLYAGASGRAILAWLPEQKVINLMGSVPLKRLSDKTPKALGELISKLRAIRKAGYALSTGEIHTDGTAVSVPILTPMNEVLGALVIVAPRYRVSKKKLVSWVPLLTQAALEVAKAYGAVVLAAGNAVGSHKTSIRKARTTLTLPSSRRRKGANRKK